MAGEVARLNPALPEARDEQKHRQQHDSDAQTDRTAVEQSPLRRFRNCQRRCHMSKYYRLCTPVPAVTTS